MDHRGEETNSLNTGILFVFLHKVQWYLEGIHFFFQVFLWWSFPAHPPRLTTPKPLISELNLSGLNIKIKKGYSLQNKQSRQLQTLYEKILDFFVQKKNGIY